MKQPGHWSYQIPLACALVRIDDDRTALGILRDAVDPKNTAEIQLVAAGYLAMAKPDDPMPIQVMERWIRSTGRDFDPTARREQVIMITSYSKGALASLIRLLADPDATVRKRSLSVLGNLREEASAAIPEVAKALQDEDALVRDEAAVVLSQLERVANRQ